MVQSRRVNEPQLTVSAASRFGSGRGVEGKYCIAQKIKGQAIQWEAGTETIREFNQIVTGKLEREALVSAAVTGNLLLWCLCLLGLSQSHISRVQTSMNGNVDSEVSSFILFRISTSRHLSMQH